MSSGVEILLKSLGINPQQVMDMAYGVSNAVKQIMQDIAGIKADQQVIIKQQNTTNALLLDLRGGTPPIANDLIPVLAPDLKDIDLNIHHAPISTNGADHG